ncbi:MAG TPA: DEAD/DEAH box helicase [Acidimicrobiia bacterium]
MGSLDVFSPPVREWFGLTFDAPTDAQEKGWPAIARGEHTLILAPTGSGKTLAAFLWAIDRMAAEPVPGDSDRTRVLYISPLKALAVDVEKNLRAPIVGVGLAAQRLGSSLHEPTVGIRSGDTPSRERQRLLRRPPDILITTPESLYLMLTSNARETLRSVRTVIVDEIHSVAGTKRGAHLALSLERLDAITASPPQRIGLSATQRPLEEIARFLGGNETPTRTRPVTIVDAGSRKELDVEVVVPVEDMGAIAAAGDQPETGPPSATDGASRAGIWPHVHPRVLELVKSHRSTLIFCNARRLAERLANRLNELAGEELVKAHHGSLAREQRLVIEDQLKAGQLKALVATSSLELGIDMGAVDLVIQVESPGSVSRGLQRIGRAGHQVGEPSKGKVFPKYRGDLLEAAVVVQRMRDGAIESTRIVRNPLDVLAQQIVAMCAVEEWAVDELSALVRRAANFSELSDDAFTAVLDLLAGRYPSDEFAGLKPRIVWDRVEGRVRAREGAQRVAVTNGGTIPDRGLFGVFLPDGTRVGELDEEMVYESRAGETFMLGATTWRVEEITHDRVTVVPAPGEPGKMPFWKGDKPGRPLELGRAMGSVVRELRTAERASGVARLRDDFHLDELAARNLMQYLAEQVEATGVLPDDRTIVVERFPDEIGDWRVCILTPFGSRVHAPWALAIEARLMERIDAPVQVLWSDDGIVLRLPESVEAIPVEELQINPDEIEDLVVGALPGSSMFASRFREAAARSLLLPKRRPGERTALWQQRQRAAGLLEVASKYGTFPVVLEATRECLQDVFDVPALQEVLRDLQARRLRMVTVDTPKASPFAQSLLFGWIAVYMYEGDAPLAERRAAALALDRDLLRELLGAEELRELIDEGALTDLELELQRLVPDRQARSADALHDVLRDLGDLSDPELAARFSGDHRPALTQLVEERRAIAITVAGEPRTAAAEDAARYRDALGAAIPTGLPAVFTDPVREPFHELIARYARTHGPFTSDEVAARFGVGEDRVIPVLTALESAQRVVRGEFRPGGSAREWCDVGVLRRLRRRSLAKLRHEIEPVEPAVLGRFLPAWQGIGSGRRSTDALLDAIAQLQGVPIPAASLDVDVLALRVDGYRPDHLDELCNAGEVVWMGAGEGRIALAFRDQAALLLPAPSPDPVTGPIHELLRAHLERAGASFWPELLAATGNPTEREVLAALWDLVWSGEVTNDSLAALRASLSKGQRTKRAGVRARPRVGHLTRLGPPAAAGRWSLVRAPVAQGVEPTARAHALAVQLLERYGVVTREAARAEGIAGGYAAVYPVLRALEESGRARRGYFVAGLGAAQFALPGAVDRLRAARERSEDRDATLVLAATDPAQPYGAALPWPEVDEGAGRPSRAAGSFVVLHAGDLVAYLERGGRKLTTFAEPQLWVDALASVVKDGRLKQLEITHVNGAPVRETVAEADALKSAGFKDAYKGLVLRG